MTGSREAELNPTDPGEETNRGHSFAFTSLHGMNNTTYWGSASLGLEQFGLQAEIVASQPVSLAVLRN